MNLFVSFAVIFCTFGAFSQTNQVPDAILQKDLNAFYKTIDYSKYGIKTMLMKNDVSEDETSIHVKNNPQSLEDGWLQKEMALKLYEYLFAKKYHLGFDIVFNPRLMSEEWVAVINFSDKAAMIDFAPPYFYYAQPQIYLRSGPVAINGTGEELKNEQNDIVTFETPSEPNKEDLNPFSLVPYSYDRMRNESLFVSARKVIAYDLSKKEEKPFPAIHVFVRQILDSLDNKVPKMVQDHVYRADIDANAWFGNVDQVENKDLPYEEILNHIDSSRSQVYLSRGNPNLGTQITDMSEVPGSVKEAMARVVTHVMFHAKIKK